MTRCRFNLRLTAEQCHLYYQGRISTIVTRSDEGLRLAFPMAELRQFFTREGVQGRFEIVFDQHHKLVNLTRVSSIVRPPTH